MQIKALCHPPGNARKAGRRWITKTMLVMRMTTILILAAALQVSARSDAQTITYSAKAGRLQTIITAIRDQTGLHIFYRKEDLQDSKPVTVHFNNTPLAIAMDAMLKGQSLRWEMQGSTIVIMKTEETKPDKDPDPIAPPHEITGRILSDKGDPLPGVSVVEKGTTNGTMTNERGEFVLAGVDPLSIVVISGANIETMEVKVNGRTRLDVKATIKVNKLDEIEIVAYGQSSQRFNVGSVTTVKSEDIEKAPVTNPLMALAGRVPGMLITQMSGFAGAGMKVRIEGQNSMTRGNDPFYVVDGIPYISQLMPNGGTVLGGADGPNGSPLSYLNPADIESITVLRDADATAIYGSRAANGAILITTKKGKAGETRIDLNARNGWSSVPRRIEMMNIRQYLEMRREAKRNDREPVYSTDYDMNGIWDTTRSVDWQKELLGSNAKYTELNASVSGGAGNARYLVSTTYNRQTTLFPSDFKDQKGTIHANINTTSANRRFRLDLSSTFQYDDNRLPNDDVSNYAYFLTPNTPPLFKPDGSINWAEDAAGKSTFPNPAAYFYNKYNTTGKNLMNSLQLGYEIITGLELSARLGYNNLRTDELLRIPLTSVRPEDLPFADRLSVFRSSEIQSYSIEPQLSFNRSIGNGKLEVTVGTSIQQTSGKSNGLTGVGYTTDRAMGDYSSARDRYVDNSVYYQYRTNGGYGRINYIHNGRYILSLTGRRDGTSRFGEKNLFHNFGAAGAGWIFTEEPFLESIRKMLSFGKLNISYGTTGSDQIGDYQFLNLFYPYQVQRLYQGGTGLLVDRLTNPYLQWEETKKLNIGLSLGFLKDRILLNVEYYRNQSGNQLMPMQLPFATGFLDIVENVPATVRNYGFNFSASSTNIKAKDLNWSTRANVSIARNRLAKFDNIAQTYFSSIVEVGKPLNSTKVFEYIGVDAQTGLYNFRDSKGNATYRPDWTTDRTRRLDLTVGLYGGLDNTITYKSFELSVFFQFVVQKGQPDGTVLPGISLNQPTALLDRWQKPGDRATYQRFSTGVNDSTNLAFDAYRNSNGQIRNASFVRLKNLSFSWSVPAAWTRAAHLRDAKIYCNAQNLLTFTSYELGDPEALKFRALPPFRTVTLGVHLGL